jgi:hypothetical protein
MTWRITHIDHHHRRRQLVLEAQTRTEAELLARLRLGDACYLALIKLRGRGV